VWDVDSKTFNELPNPNGYIFNNLDWSPDGTRIVASSEADRVTVIWDVNTGEMSVLEQGDLSCYLASPSWSPAGDRIVTGCERDEKDTPARIWDADTGQELKRLESVDGNSRFVAWSPDGRSIAVGYSEMDIRIWDLDSLQPRIKYSGHSDRLADLSWSPNSKRVVSIDAGGFIRVWDALTGDEVRSFKTTNTPNSIDWSPDGEYVIAATYDPGPDIRRVWQSTEGLVRYAEQCCVWRELDPGERLRFGLPSQ
jgi:WD40 repeat protein